MNREAIKLGLTPDGSVLVNRVTRVTEYQEHLRIEAANGTVLLNLTMLSDGRELSTMSKCRQLSPAEARHVAQLLLVAAEAAEAAVA